VFLSTPHPRITVWAKASAEKRNNKKAGKKWRIFVKEEN
tara:strand:+ start:37103 stop:37219 length:117 start_codon:yes stop_codon:yes gene_type:complete